MIVDGKIDLVFWMGRFAVASDDVFQRRFFCFVAGGHLIFVVEADDVAFVRCFLSLVDELVNGGLNLLVDVRQVVVVVH